VYIDTPDFMQTQSKLNWLISRLCNAFYAYDLVINTHDLLESKYST